MTACPVFLLLFPRFLLCLMTEGVLSLEEMNQVMRWMRIWPYIGFPSSSPPPVLSHVITESAAGRNQQRGHGYLKQNENNICSQQVILKFSFHSSPNTHHRKDEKRSEQPCFILRENWVVQALDACPYTCGHGMLGQCNHHYPEEAFDLCTLQRAI